MYDLVIIGGGINGAGIARDAAGRGLSVLLVEQGDLACATSSNSTKLIHGGLRYLEHYEFKLVRESLNERERLLKSAPHIIWPIEFILPHDRALRPKWMIRAGLFLYDLLGKRNILPGSKGLNLAKHKAGVPLKDHYKAGFSYADCWVDDARLVMLCAKSAAEKGADIRTYTACTGLRPNENGAFWHVELHDKRHDKISETQAKCVVNAAGPWVRTLLEDQKLTQPDTFKMRLSKGSHIIVHKLYEGDHAYILQQPDGRIVFAIPYEHGFTLIGTTDVAYDGPPENAAIERQEIDYLCAAASQSFKTPVTPDMIVHSYSGVRGLLDSGDSNLSEVTRDYKLDLEHGFGPPLLNVFGGKITTFRKLSEHALKKLCPIFGLEPKGWTKTDILPGGDMAAADFEAFLAAQTARYPEIDPALLRRYARAYGTRVDKILCDLGHDFGHGIYEGELRYAVREEWVRTAEDFLWRRSKLGLHIDENTRKAVDAALTRYIKEYEDDLTSSASD